MKRIVIPAKAGIQAVFPLIATSEPDDAFGINWIPAFAGMTGGICGDDGWGLREHRNRWRRAPANRAIPGALQERIGFVSQIFFDVIESKALLTPEKRFRNEPQSASVRAAISA